MQAERSWTSFMERLGVMWVVLLILGFGILWTVMRWGWPAEEIPQIAALAMSGIVLLWGFVLAPLGIQLMIEILAVVLVLGLHRWSFAVLQQQFLQRRS